MQKKGVRSEHLRVEDDLVGTLWLEKIGWHLVSCFPVFPLPSFYGILSLASFLGIPSTF